MKVLINKPRKALPPNVSSWAKRHANVLPIQYTTNRGVSLVGKSEEILTNPQLNELYGSVQLIFTSPPFPLNRKKKYGNYEGDEFKRWLASYAPVFRRLLTPTGSIVMEMGNAWEPGEPVMSTLAIESLLAFKKAANFFLCEEFIWHNPAKLPTPAQWVTVERIRVKDSFTRLWWMSPTARPKADNRRVLVPYSKSMQQLLRNGTYNSGKRPSEHHIGQTSFLTDNGGAIPPNFLSIPNEEIADNVLVGSNTVGGDSYQLFCKKHNLLPHPARMPQGLAEFFVKLCTDENDLVLDPFSGSNITGAVAEKFRRQWVSVEADVGYALSGQGRFQ